MVILTPWQKRNRVRWVHDLLSGNFKQGNNYLKSQSGTQPLYCCLGVAGERICPSDYKMKLDWIRGNFERSVGVYLPPIRAFLSLGLTSKDQVKAGQWNDNDEYSFERIADFIAYATDKRLRFQKTNHCPVPVGYAQKWLED